MHLRQFAHLAGPAVASMSLVVTGSILGCSAPYQIQGAATYEGQKFIGCEGQFRSIAVAPTGARVAFFGQESSSAGDLFIADVDGAIQRVATTSSSDGLISWAADGNSLCYGDLVPRPDGTLDGATIEHYTIAMASVQPAMVGIPLIPFFLSPDGSQVLVAGHANQDRVPLPQSTNQLLDVGTGKLKAVAPSYSPVGQSWAAAWAPGGKTIALAETTTEIATGPVKIVLVASPGWDTSQTSFPTASGRYTGMAWEDDKVLRVADIVPGDYLKITRVGTDGATMDTSQVVLDSPPITQRYGYGQPLFSRDGKRVLLSRQVVDINSQNQVGPRQLMVCDGQTVRMLPTSQDLEPVGWVDDHRVLCLDGFYQNRHPVVLDAGGAP